MCEFNAYIPGNIRYSLLSYLKNTEFLVVPLNCSCGWTWISQLSHMEKHNRSDQNFSLISYVCKPVSELLPCCKVTLLFIHFSQFCSERQGKQLPLESKSIWYKKPHFHLKNTKASIRFWFTLVHWIIHSSSLFISAEMISSLINFR